MKAYITPHDFLNLDQERALLQEIGVELIEIDSEDPVEIGLQAKDGVALFVEYTRIPAETVKELDNCKIIMRYGIGFDNVDLVAAGQRGIYVCNVPRYCINEVADHTFSFLLAAARKLVSSNSAVHQGRWEFLSHRPIQCLAGKVLGLAGFGHIAQQVAKRAAGFDMNIITYDPWASAEALETYGVRAVTLEELLQTSDYLSLHVPLNEDTKHFVNRTSLQQMKHDVVIINTARGGLIDTLAVSEALAAGVIGGVCVDVLEQEPPAQNHPLIGMKGAIITPHSAYYSEESLPRLQLQAAEEVVRVLKGKAPQSPVNLKWM
jgi:D-3-phosphoglycerate dehydrogenase